MNKRRERCWNQFNPQAYRGLTLVEVVASLGLLTTVMVGMLTGLTRHANQITTAKHRFEAIEELDQLLSKWHRHEQRLKDGSSGQCAEHEHWRWQVKALPHKRDDALGLEVLEVAVFTSTNFTNTSSQTAGRLARVEVVVLSDRWKIDAP